MTDTPISQPGAIPATGAPHDPTDQRSQNDGATDAAKNAAHDVEQSGRKAASDVAEDAKAEARHVLDDARTQLRTEAEAQSHRAAAVVRDFSDELHSIADNGDQSGYLTNLADDGAERLDRLYHRLDNDGLDGVLHDVRAFARRRPVMFLGACFGAGVVAGRLLHNADLGELGDAVRSGASDDESSDESAVGDTDELAPPTAASTGPAVPIHTDVTATNTGPRS